MKRKRKQRAKKCGRVYTLGDLEAKNRDLGNKITHLLVAQHRMVELISRAQERFADNREVPLDGYFWWSCAHSMYLDLQDALKEGASGLAQSL